MDSIAPLAQRMPYTTAFPKALGTGLLISTPHPITAELRGEMERFIDEYEHALSRFRADSLVAHIGNAEHGGHFDFPDWAGPLFDLYDALHAATRGAIDPCVGEDLIRLGYDPALSFTVEADAGERLGALHGRAVWGRDVVRSSGTTLVTRSPVHVDFGACGKGYLVDSLGGLLTDSELSRTSHVKSAETTNPTCQSSTSDSKRESAAPEFVIDAGGDLLARTNKPIRVALEDPDDPSCAVGVALIGDGAFCASAPSRRHWEVAVNEQTHLAIHHLLNAIDGLPVQQTEAAWVAVQSASFGDYPTAVADGLATALFVADPNELRSVLFSIAPRWTPTVTPPSAPVSPAVSSDCRPVTDCQVGRVAARQSQTANRPIASKTHGMRLPAATYRSHQSCLSRSMSAPSSISPSRVGFIEPSTI